MDLAGFEPTTFGDLKISNQYYSIKLRALLISLPTFLLFLPICPTRTLDY